MIRLPPARRQSRLAISMVRGCSCIFGKGQSHDLMLLPMTSGPHVVNVHWTSRPSPALYHPAVHLSLSPPILVVLRRLGCHRERLQLTARQSNLWNMGTLPSTHELIDGYTFLSVTVDAPDWYVCPVYKIVLGEERSFNHICAESPLEFPPALFGTLQSTSPPTLDFFRSLPSPPTYKVWGIYVILMEKMGSRPKLYVGSGTGTSGVQDRLRHYELKHRLPRFVQAAFDEGYAISHKGLICWSPIPSVGLIPKARVRFLAVEATFCHLFFAAVETRLDVLWTSFLPWRREDVKWLPLCSHSPLMERPAGDPSMTPEQLEQYNTERKARARVLMRESSRR